MTALVISGAFKLPNNMSMEEALFRLSVRLRQIAKGEVFDPDDWKGTIELVEKADIHFKMEKRE